MAWKLFASESGEQQGTIAVLAAAAGSLLTAGGGWLIKLYQFRFGERRSVRRDTIEEYQTLLEQNRRDLFRSRKRQDAQERQIYNLQAEHANCIRESAEAKGEIRLLQSQVRRLQELTDDTAPGTVMPALVTAMIDGTIVSVMGGMAPLLHWLPSELVGHSIDLIIPERLRESHRAGMVKATSPGYVADPESAILTYALVKDGSEVPVSVNLSSFASPKGQLFINAEIRRRHLRPAPVVTFGPMGGPNLDERTAEDEPEKQAEP